MAVMLGKLHAALIAAGVEPDTAREAAEEVAAYDRDIADLKADVKLLKWMVGTNTLITLGVLWKVLTL